MYLRVEAKVMKNYELCGPELKIPPLMLSNASVHLVHLLAFPPPPTL